MLISAIHILISRVGGVECLCVCEHMARYFPSFHCIWHQISQLYLDLDLTVCNVLFVEFFIIFTW